MITIHRELTQDGIYFNILYAEADRWENGFSSERDALLFAHEIMGADEVQIEGQVVDVADRIAMLPREISGYYQSLATRS